MASKRKRLTLKEKIEIINASEKEKLSARILAERFGVGKTQVSDIVRNKEELMKLWITNSNENAKNVKMRKTESGAIDSILFDWFTSVRTKNIPVAGPLLQEKALEISREIGIENFKASNGWLEKFRARHNISFKTICGEAKSVDAKEVSDWNERLKTICVGYEDRNVFNADETGLFFRIMPNKTLCLRKEECIGGKVSKERLTLLLCCNMLGEFETPLLIGRALKPRCFKNIDVSKLGVIWRANKKAWMTRALMTEWLTAFNAKMKKERRSAPLFMDNATSHPVDLKLTNVKIVFFPPNTTSVCQPLDQGVIRSFKAWYRKCFLRYLITQLDTCEKAEELPKSVNVLHAVTWVNSAIKNVKPQCVSRCFRKAGFVLAVNDDGVCALNAEEEDEDTISELMTCLDCEGNAKDFIAVDDELCCEETTDDLHEFISSHTPMENDMVKDAAGEAEEEEAVDAVAEEVCEIKSYKDAAKYSEELQKIFISKGDSEGLVMLMNLKIHIEKEAVNGKRKKQTLLSDFFACKNADKGSN